MATSACMAGAGLTAEVAIYNNSAVVVAADSAVTVGSTKIHRTASKIFQLCDSAPIGVMIYGYAELSGTPWETLVKLFRARHGNDQFATVRECSERFREFLQRGDLRNESGTDESLARFAIRVVEMAKEEAGDFSKGYDAKLERALKSEIKSYAPYIGSMLFDAPDIKAFTEQAKGIIDPVVEEIFDGLDYKVPPSLHGRFYELVLTALKSSYHSPLRSGVVVFGFGNDELFPALCEQQYDCAPLGILRTTQFVDHRFEADGAAIVPFADRDVMDTLITGISNRLRPFVVASIRHVAEEVASRVLKENVNMGPDESKVAIGLTKKAVDDVADRFTRRWDGYIHQRFVYKMMEVIEHMSKEDLAVIAEALVDVTALRIRTSDAIESVGGPVDVCVVSKGDGLIWVKRKNYFDLSKNLQYLRRRFGDVRPIFAGEGHVEE